MIVGDRFDTPDGTMRIVRFCEEPNTGLVVVESRGYEFSIPHALLEPALIELGHYCHKGNGGCFCRVGWPVERQCSLCREGAPRSSFCICAPGVPA